MREERGEERESTSMCHCSLHFRQEASEMHDKPVCSIVTEVVIPYDRLNGFEFEKIYRVAVEMSGSHQIDEGCREGGGAEGQTTIYRQGIRYRM